MSHDPQDCFEHGLLSSCCGARVMLGDICSECKEHCDVDSEEEDLPSRSIERRPVDTEPAQPQGGVVSP